MRWTRHLSLISYCLAQFFTPPPEPRILAYRSSASAFYARGHPPCFSYLEFVSVAPAASCVSSILPRPTLSAAIFFFRAHAFIAPGVTHLTLTTSATRLSTFPPNGRTFHHAPDPPTQRALSHSCTFGFAPAFAASCVRGEIN